MDAFGLILLCLISFGCWMAAIFDPSTPVMWRILGIVPGIFVVMGYLFYVVGAMNSPVMNEQIGGGWLPLIFLGLGPVAFLSRTRPQKPRPPESGLPA